MVLNNKLKNDYSYYSSDLYVQKEASDNLGLSDKNSTLVIIPAQQGSKTNSGLSVGENMQGINAWINLIKSKI